MGAGDGNGAETFDAAREVGAVEMNEIGTVGRDHAFQGQLKALTRQLEMRVRAAGDEAPRVVPHPPGQAVVSRHGNGLGSEGGDPREAMARAARVILGRLLSFAEKRKNRDTEVPAQLP